MVCDASCAWVNQCPCVQSGCANEFCSDSAVMFLFCINDPAYGKCMSNVKCGRNVDNTCSFAKNDCHRSTVTGSGSASGTSSASVSGSGSVNTHSGAGSQVETGSGSGTKTGSTVGPTTTPPTTGSSTSGSTRGSTSGSTNGPTTAPTTGSGSTGPTTAPTSSSGSTTGPTTVAPTTAPTTKGQTDASKVAIKITVTLDTVITADQAAPFVKDVAAVLNVDVTRLTVLSQSTDVNGGSTLIIEISAGANPTAHDLATAFIQARTDKKFTTTWTKHITGVSISGTADDNIGAASIPTTSFFAVAAMATVMLL